MGKKRMNPDAAALRSALRFNRGLSEAEIAAAVNSPEAVARVRDALSAPEHEPEAAVAGNASKVILRPTSEKGSITRWPGDPLSKI